VRYCRSLGNVERVVVPRKMSFREIRTLTDNLADLGLEFEAMVLGYRCLFNDEYCFTWHCSPRCDFCKHFPYSQKSVLPRFPDDWKDRLKKMLAAPEDQLADGSPLDRFVKEFLSRERRELRPLSKMVKPREDEESDGGMSRPVAHELYQNCGLCSIEALRGAGVDVLKLPSRGLGRLKLRSPQILRELLEGQEVSPRQCRELIDSPAFCESPGSCYYSR
jgi:collagenase-like PrtC family protease